EGPPGGGDGPVGVGDGGVRRPAELLAGGGVDRRVRATVLGRGEPPVDEQPLLVPQIHRGPPRLAGRSPVTPASHSGATTVPRRCALLGRRRWPGPGVGGRRCPLTPAAGR